MVKRKSNTLTSMSAIEKKFIRRFVDEVLKPQGVRKKHIPELKREALEKFRAKHKIKCATLADDYIDVLLGEEDIDEEGLPTRKGKIWEEEEDEEIEE